MSMQILGAILFIVPFATLYLWTLGENIYWLYQCYTKGGDWKYYAGKVITIIAVTMVVVGLVLMCL